MTCKIDLRDIIVGEASAQGVPPEIALAVATQETGICHWRPDGSVILGKATKYGQAIGVMQLLPQTAAMLGVDPTDVNDNIYGGVKYLRQLFDRYGDWGLAVQHYNGSGPGARAYQSDVMTIAATYGFGQDMPSLFVPAGSNSASGSQAPPGSPNFFSSVFTLTQTPPSAVIRSLVTPEHLVVGGLVITGVVLAWGFTSD